MNELDKIAAKRIADECVGPTTFNLPLAEVIIKSACEKAYKSGYADGLEINSVQPFPTPQPDSAATEARNQTYVFNYEKRLRDIARRLREIQQAKPTVKLGDVITDIEDIYNCPKPDAAATQGQEWTHDTLDALIYGAWSRREEHERIITAHNAAIAAERDAAYRQGYADGLETNSVPPFPTPRATASEQPEADFVAADHHPSCTLNDQDLMWVCAQCGLQVPAEHRSHSAAATQGQEWKVEADDFAHDWIRTPNGEHMSSLARICAAHNAAIAAEREKWEAESDRRDADEADYGQKMIAEIQARDKQLAALRSQQQDTERLDWLQNRSLGFLNSAFVGCNLREAIDAAMCRRHGRRRNLTHG